MKIVFIGLLFTLSILLIVGMIYIGRELHRIRILLEHGGRQIEEYLAVVLTAEDDCVKDNATPPQQMQLSNEEKKMLWSFDPEQLLSDVIGDIF